MSSVSNTGVGPAARNLRLQKLSSIPAFAKERPSIKNKPRSGTQFAAAPQQSGPAAPPPQISTRSIKVLSPAMPHELTRDLRVASRRVSIDDFVNEVQRRFSNATQFKGERVVGVVVLTAAKSPERHLRLRRSLRSLLAQTSAQLRRGGPNASHVPPAASRDNANGFLRRLNGRETQETEPGVYRWRESRKASSLKRARRPPA